MPPLADSAPSVLSIKILPGQSGTFLSGMPKSLYSKNRSTWPAGVTKPQTTGIYRNFTITGFYALIPSPKKP